MHSTACTCGWHQPLAPVEGRPRLEDVFVEELYFFPAGARSCYGYLMYAGGVEVACEGLGLTYVDERSDALLVEVTPTRGDVPSFADANFGVGVAIGSYFAGLKAGDAPEVVYVSTPGCKVDPQTLPWAEGPLSRTYTQSASWALQWDEARAMFRHRVCRFWCAAVVRCMQLRGEVAFASSADFVRYVTALEVEMVAIVDAVDRMKSGAAGVDASAQSALVTLATCILQSFGGELYAADMCFAFRQDLYAPGCTRIYIPAALRFRFLAEDATCTLAVLPRPVGGACGRVWVPVSVHVGNVDPQVSWLRRWTASFCRVMRHVTKHSGVATWILGDPHDPSKNVDVFMLLLVRCTPGGDELGVAVKSAVERLFQGEDRDVDFAVAALATSYLMDPKVAKVATATRCVTSVGIVANECMEVLASSPEGVRVQVRDKPQKFVTYASRLFTVKRVLAQVATRYSTQSLVVHVPPLFQSSGLFRDLGVQGIGRKSQTRNVVVLPPLGRHCEDGIWDVKPTLREVQLTVSHYTRNVQPVVTIVEDCDLRVKRKVNARLRLEASAEADVERVDGRLGPILEPTAAATRLEVGDPTPEVILVQADTTLELVDSTSRDPKSEDAASGVELHGSNTTFAAQSLEVSGSDPVLTASHSETGPHSELVVAHLESVFPHSELAVPHSELAVLHSELAVPHSELAVPHSELPILHLESAAPHLESAAPHLESAAPHLESAAPHLESVAPHLESVAPGFESSAPGLESSAPGLESSAPGPESSAPGPESSAPGPDSSGSDFESSDSDFDFESSAPGLESSAPGLESSGSDFESSGSDFESSDSPFHLESLPAAKVDVIMEPDDVDARQGHNVAESEGDVCDSPFADPMLMLTDARPTGSKNGPQHPVYRASQVPGPLADTIYSGPGTIDQRGTFVACGLSVRLVAGNVTPAHGQNKDPSPTSVSHMFLGQDGHVPDFLHTSDGELSGSGGLTHLMTLPFSPNLMQHRGASQVRDSPVSEGVYGRGEKRGRDVESPASFSSCKTTGNAAIESARKLGKMCSVLECVMTNLLDEMDVLHHDAKVMVTELAWIIRSVPNIPQDRRAAIDGILNKYATWTESG